MTGAIFLCIFMPITFKIFELATSNFTYRCIHAVSIHVYLSIKDMYMKVQVRITNILHFSYHICSSHLCFSNLCQYLWKYFCKKLKILCMCIHVLWVFTLMIWTISLSVHLAVIFAHLFHNYVRKLLNIYEITFKYNMYLCAMHVCINNVDNIFHIFHVVAIFVVLSHLY